MGNDVMNMSDSLLLNTSVSSQALNASFTASQPRMCLEHSKFKQLICLECRVNVCETCALFGSHQQHKVSPPHEVFSKINVRMEMLMANF